MPSLLGHSATAEQAANATLTFYPSMVMINQVVAYLYIQQAQNNISIHVKPRLYLTNAIQILSVLTAFLFPRIPEGNMWIFS